MRNQDDSEVDFLAGPPGAETLQIFRSEVKAAFLLEHGCTSDKAIARVIGRSPGRISQILSGNTKPDPDTIRSLIRHVSNPARIARIVRLWDLLVLGIDPWEAREEPVVGDVSEKTLRTINRMIGGGRLRAAAQTAQEAFSRTEDVVLAERLLDTLATLHQRLDRLGPAMHVACLIAERAELRNDRPRRLWAEVLRIRLLLCLPTVLPTDVVPLIDQLRVAAATISPRTPASYLVFDPSHVELLELLAHVVFVERRVTALNAPYLRRSLAVLRGRAARGPVKSRHTPLLLAARIHLIFGETFHAQELLDGSAKALGLNLMEGCSVVMGRVLAETDSVEASIAYLLEAESLAHRNSDFQHAHVIDRDLTLLESRRFPGTPPAPGRA